MLPFVMTEKEITVIVDGKPYTFMEGSDVYDKVKSAIRTGSSEEVARIIKSTTEPEEDIERGFCKKDDKYFYNGIQVDKVIFEKIAGFKSLGIDTEPIEKFTQKLLSNPNYESISDLYRFLESNKLPINDDGNFIAYKAVSSDFKDFHSRSYDNSPGKTVSMPRDSVQFDRNITCSRGLHFAAYKYARDFMGSSGRLIVVEIDPADVVSIPTDYNNEKGRCCKYKVLSEVTDSSDALMGAHHSSEINDEAMSEPEAVVPEKTKKKLLKKDVFKYGKKKILKNLLKDKSKVYKVNGAGMVIPSVKYVTIDGKRYKVQKSIYGRKINFGRFDKLSDAEYVAYNIVKAEMKGNLDSFVEKYMEKKK